MLHSSSSHEIPSTIFTFVMCFLFFYPIVSSEKYKDFRQEETYMSGNQLKNMTLINEHLKMINKPFVKSFKSPDGDVIDCVLINLQPAFDLPQLKGTMPLDPPELPNGHNTQGIETEIKQLWSSNGESCPNGTIPIRRTSASDILRSNSISKFGNKFNAKDTVRDHEHAMVTTKGQFYGAQAFLNIWQPNVAGDDFSVSQIWVITNVPTHKVQSVEAGWQAYPGLNKDNRPRLFSYWTPDGYLSGCYNLQCRGFVQINRRISLGAAIDPISTYNGQQMETSFTIWKDPKSENWWLRVGKDVIGYWPSSLFTDLRKHATTVGYGGEVYAENFGKHTSTQMGSGHFPNEGFKKTAYSRNLEVVTYENNLIPVSNLIEIVDKPNCYGVTKGFNNVWGNYIYFGGPGNNPNCP